MYTNESFLLLKPECQLHYINNLHRSITSADDYNSIRTKLCAKKLDKNIDLTRRRLYHYCISCGKISNQANATNHVSGRKQKKMNKMNKEYF